MPRRIVPRTRAATGRVLPGLAFGLVVFVQGCTGLIPGKQSATAAAPGGDGAFQVTKGRPGVVIGAPPGVSDADTDRVARELASLTGFGLVVGRSSASRPPGAQIEATGEDAHSAYHAYRRHLADAAQGPLRLYVEVHGDGPRETVPRLQMTTVGFSADDAWRLKTLLELIRDSRVKNPVPRFDVSVEPSSVSQATVSAAGSAGALAALRTLRIDVPRAARTTYRDAYASVLAAFLTESATFLAARER